MQEGFVVAPELNSRRGGAVRGQREEINRVGKFYRGSVESPRQEEKIIES